MHRDPLPQPKSRKLAPASSIKFFGLADAIAKHHEPTPTQLAALERSYQAVGQYVIDSDEFSSLAIRAHAQGSRAIGTIIRPLWADAFDIDLVIRLHRSALQTYGDPDGPVRLINDLYAVLKRYAEVHSLGIKKWERCITLKYADEMCVDVAPIIDEPSMVALFGDTHAKIPDRELKRYEPSNPEGLASSFNKTAKISPVFTAMETLHSYAMDSARGELQPLPDANEVMSRLLCRLIQLMKIHRDKTFGAPTLDHDFAPKSIFITTLAAAAYEVRAQIAHESPLDLFLDSEYWSLHNLTAPGDNLASGMNSDANQQAFFLWHARLVRDLTQLLECIEHRAGTDELIKLVKEIFGDRAARAVVELDAPRPLDRPGQRLVMLGTAAAATISMPARAHTFFGK
jgi:hypothetical protein